jgi:uncharacterized protein (DUF169 family)
MDLKIELNQIQEYGARMISILGLHSQPVGVHLLTEQHQAPEGATLLEQHRYCQALMKARHGANVLLGAENLSCPAAASVFGFRPLPEGLRSGKGLVGFGIVADEAVGKRMFEGMPKLTPGQIKWLHLFPLSRAMEEPDVIIVEDEIESLMWIALASLHATGGERVQGSTAVLQATCVDATIIPYLEKRLNYSYGCYGCRDATDMEKNEAVLGFPGELLEGIVRHLEFLHEKAIPNSRSKNAWIAFGKRA